MFIDPQFAYVLIACGSLLFFGFIIRIATRANKQVSNQKTIIDLLSIIALQQGATKEEVKVITEK